MAKIDWGRLTSDADTFWSAFKDDKNFWTAAAETWLTPYTANPPLSCDIFADPNVVAACEEDPGIAERLALVHGVRSDFRPAPNYDVDLDLDWPREPPIHDPFPDDPGFYDPSPVWTDPYPTPTPGRSPGPWRDRYEFPESGSTGQGSTGQGFGTDYGVDLDLDYNFDD